MASHHEHSKHKHDHGAEGRDPGAVYSEAWVQDLVLKIQAYLQQNVDWLSIESTKVSRVLDYACGHGTISLALLNTLPSTTTFQGIDIHPKQVERYNASALNESAQERMSGIQGDLANPSAELNKPEYFDFDVAIMSMALHHCPDPAGMLEQLQRRLKKDGVLILVEGLGRKPHAHGGHQQPHHVHHYTEEESMIEHEIGGKIWPGFTKEYFEHSLAAAGFKDVEVRVPGIGFDVPEGGAAVGFSELVFVRGVAE
ncbi:hypothetical protein LTR37_018507 [Vermiconidia calcicola]|uniref:Uncharacterized protein n=1 Tax=Vermiconidia calcicola TaxID=1690605 RepID=A0ACC3MGP3_9PEZI|nr:hypothetical protein LTR37_018507 [Vermiconidia calcicola]